MWLRRHSPYIWLIASAPSVGRYLKQLGLFGLIFIGAVSEIVQADEVTIAIAANFLIPSRALESAFEATSGHQIVVTSGSTGQLYAQIVNGAPYDILLAADQERPRLLAERDLGDSSSVFTYAIGQLALWSNSAERIREDSLNRLLDIEFRWLAIPEPNVAPYGHAARLVFDNLGVWSALEGRIVTGQNVGQTFAMIETGNAQLGLVALSQALAYDGQASYLVVPSELYDPIRQDAILLRRAVENTAAHEFLAFLKTPAAAEIMGRYGYSVTSDL
jgi:molybdate transport system substrate-binding protein